MKMHCSISSWKEGVGASMGGVSERKSQLSPAKRALLDIWGKGMMQMPQKIPRRSESGPAPLSYAQQRLWFLDQLDPHNVAYNVPIAWRLTGPLAIDVVRSSLAEIIRRHDILRTTFIADSGLPLQVVSPTCPSVQMQITDLRALPKAEREVEIVRLATAEAQRPFDLARGPLLYVAILQLSKIEHVLLLTMHHIVTDGWSIGILLRELSMLYAAFSCGTPSPLVELSIQYADFAVWQRQGLQSMALDTQLSYWKRRLGILAILDLHTDRPRPEAQTYRGASYFFDISTLDAVAMATLSRQAGVTLFMVLLTTFIVVLSHNTGQQDIVVGTDIANRSRVETEDLIGFFVNQLVLRIDVSGNPTLREILGRVRMTAAEAYAHQDLPFEKLVEALKPTRTLMHPPLFQVKLILQNASIRIPPLPSLTVHPLTMTDHAVQLDLILEMWETQDGLGGRFSYNKDLFDASTVVGMATDVKTVFHTISANPGYTLRDVRMCILSERAKRSMEPSGQHKPTLAGFKDIKPKAVSLRQETLVATSYLHPDIRFPLVIQPGQDGIDVVDWVASNLGFVETELLTCGAILFRGFRVDTAHAFERLVRAMCKDLFNENGEHPRETVTGNVSAPTFFPPDRRLLWHNENSFNNRWPLKIWFGCIRPAAQGGETPLVDSRRVFANIRPELKERFMQKGIMYVRNYGTGLGLDWRTVFQTSDRSIVEAKCKENQCEFEWKDADKLRTRSIRPAVAKHPKTGAISWFNQAQHWHLSCLDEDTRTSLLQLFHEEDLPRNCYYGDGSLIEDSVMHEILSVYEKLEVAFPWEAGDVVLLDNVLTAHGRNPYKGERKQLVALGEMQSYGYLEEQGMAHGL